MSVSNPLIKELKADGRKHCEFARATAHYLNLNFYELLISISGHFFLPNLRKVTVFCGNGKPFTVFKHSWTRKLTECETEINDDNPNLQPFCENLEKCLEIGVLMRFNSIGFPRLPDAWYWLSEIPYKNLSTCNTYSLAAEQVKENPKVHTATGQLRLLIRICLVRKCLHTPVEILVRTPLLARDFYDPNSILGDGILGEIFLSVLFQTSKLNFKLDLRNASFLDESWQLPECKALELVPCKSLGISICFVRERAFIVNMDKTSIAAEDDKVEIGDVLDEINGNPITSSTKGKLRKIMRNASGLPISLYIIKHYSKKLNEIYGPIVHLIKCSGIETVQAVLKTFKANKCEKETEDNCLEVENKCRRAGFSVNYCGSIFIGSQGDVKQIEGAIYSLLQTERIKPIPVRFECLELGIRVTSDIDDTVIFNQNYMEIASCGRTANSPDYFAFIAGETNCSVATKFEAHVFYHLNEKEVRIILQSLGHGFQRTHFAV